MPDVATKICNQCGAEKNRDTDFGAKSDSPDGRRATCKSCFNESRKKRKNKSPEFKALRRLNDLVKQAHAVMEDPNAGFDAKHRADQTIRNADKRREKILAPIEAERKELETAVRAAETSPSLDRVRAQFYFNPFAESHGDLRQMVVEMNTALAELSSAADVLARQYLMKTLAVVERTIHSRAFEAKQKADEEQDLRDRDAIRRAIGEIHDEWLPRIRAAKKVSVTVALRKALWKLKHIAEDAAKSTDKDDTGAQVSVVANALAKEYDKLARLLYGKADKPLHENDTLENIQSRVDSANAAQEWLEQAELDRQKYWADLQKTDPKRFEKESKSLTLQVKGNDHWANLERQSFRSLKKNDPAEYERRALEALKPRNVVQNVIVYVVPTVNGVAWYWPDGRLVRRGTDVQHAEVIKDARLGWCMAPEPASAELESPSSAKQELIQEDDGSWHWVAEGSRGVWNQQADGTWKQTRNGVNPWAKPVKITFQNAEPQIEEGRDHFRFGTWWTLAEVQKAEGTAYSEIPPAVLPPLQRVVADSVATEPQRPSPKDDVEPNRWKRFEQQERFRKDQDAALLRGVFVWDKSAAKSA